MEIINRLSDVAHDEKLFKWVLESFKAELFDDDNKIDLTLKFRDEIGKYYSKIRKDALIKDGYEIYKIDDFCIVYLAEMFNKIDQEQELKLKAIKQNLNIETLSKDEKNCFQSSKANDYLTVLKFIFTEGVLYQYEKAERAIYFDNAERMLDRLSLNLIQELFGIKLKFFVGLKKSESCSISHLGLITVPFEEVLTEDNFFKVYSHTINHIVDVFIRNLFFNGISKPIQNELINKYHYLNNEEFETNLIESISECVLNGKIEPLLSDVAEIIKEIKNEENEVNRKIKELYTNKDLN